MWRHILVVELLKRKFNITNEDSQKNYTRHIRSVIYKKDRIKEQAVEYLENWGNKFWLTTDERMKGLTSKIEGNLSASVIYDPNGKEVASVGIFVDLKEQLEMERKRPARISVAYNADVASVQSFGGIRFKAAIAVLLGALVCSVLLAIITGQSSRESNTPAK